MTVKLCIKCGEEKELEYFCKSKNYKDGRRGTCKRCHTNYMLNYYKNNPDKNREKIKLNTKPKAAWKRHRITEEQYNKLYSLYDGKCHSCKKNEAICIDHDHLCCQSNRSCGKCVRGILCHHCNTALGLLKDDVNVIILLAEYARSF